MGKDNKLDRKLYDAVKSGKTELVKELLEKGADPNAPVGKKGLTCMYRAAQKNFLDIEELLMNRGGTLHSSSTMARRLQVMYDADQENNQAARTVQHIENYSSDVSEDHANAKEQLPIHAESSRARTQRSSESVEEVFLVHEYDNAVSDTSRLCHVSRMVDSLRTSIKRASSEEVPAPSNKNESLEWNIPRESDVFRNDQLEFDRSKLKQVRKLGEGHFGVVFEGEASGILPNEVSTRVAVKMLSDSTPESRIDFLKEAQIMSMITGSNFIIKLLGVSTAEEPFLMIMELMARGDLKTLLRNCRPKTSKPAPFSMRILISMGGDIAEGMAYLQQARVVHRDLAARNCLVNDDWKVKIGDFGLTRDVYAGEYYRMTGSAPLPVRWMAPESIEDGVFTTQSDIWAFGIVLWELITFAKMPYAGLSNLEVIEQVTEQAYRLSQPKGIFTFRNDSLAYIDEYYINGMPCGLRPFRQELTPDLILDNVNLECPDDIYGIMLDCWDADPDLRPDFNHLTKQIRTLALQFTDEKIEKGKQISRIDSSTILSSNKHPSSDHLLSNTESTTIKDLYVEMTHQSKASTMQTNAPFPNETTIQNYQGVSYIANTNDDDELIYSQPINEKYSNLTSMELAIQVAKDESEIQEVDLKMSESKAVSVVSRNVIEDEANEDSQLQQQHVSERIDDQQPSRSKHKPKNAENNQQPSDFLPCCDELQSKTETSLNKPDTLSTSNNGPTIHASANSKDGTRCSVSAMKNVWLQHGQQAKLEAERTNFKTSKSVSSVSSQQVESKSQSKQATKHVESMKEDSVIENELASGSQQIRSSLFGARSKAKTKPKYGGATTWVTAGVPVGNHVIGHLPESRQRDIQRNEQSLSQDTEKTNDHDTHKTVEVTTQERHCERSESKIAHPVMSPMQNQQLQTDRTTLLISDMNFLANDASQTALKAQESMSQAYSKAERDIEKWIEAVIGDYVSGASLQEFLKSGDILCQIMNKVQPNSIKSFHEEPTLAFKQMENIGYFLDAAKRYGLPDSDLFITVDLFESRNMKQVVICLAALKKLAESKGFRL